MMTTACATADAAMRPSSDVRDGHFAGPVDIGGRELYMECEGVGRPVVILESGIHDSSDVWSVTDVAPPVAVSPNAFAGLSRFTRVCRYDRPGTVRYTHPPTLTARSTKVFAPRGLPDMARDLHNLLTNARIPAPYLLVGHSYGGMIVRLFAQTYPAQAAGLVLIDAFSSELQPLLPPSDWTAYVALINHPGIDLDRQAGFETANIDGAVQAVRRAPPLPLIPLAVISKTRPFAIAPGVSKALMRKVERAWPAAQNELVKLEPQTPHILATGSDHYVQVHDPDVAISAIRLLFDRIIAHGSQRAKNRNLKG